MYWGIMTVIEMKSFFKNLKKIFMNIYLVQKETQCFYLQFLGLKILISKVVLIQWLCLLFKTLIAEFRRKLDTVLCFECKILKS